MNSLLSCSAAVVTGPLFGNTWLALLAILVGIAVFIALVAGVGRWLAATHPAASPAQPGIPAPAAAPVAANTTVQTPLPTPEILAIIAAAVRVTFGARARIAEVVPVKPAAPSIETLMQQWSMEGRRQIYSSHQIR